MRIELLRAGRQRNTELVCVKVYLTLSKDVAEQLEHEARRLFGARRDAKSAYVEMVLRAVFGDAGGALRRISEFDVNAIRRAEEVSRGGPA